MARPEPDDRPLVPGRWSRRRRDWAVALWVSFLAACGGTFVLFALIDPERFGQAWVMGWETSLRLTYGLGFFFLFFVALGAAVLTAWMIRTGPAPGHARGEGVPPPPQVRDPGELNPDLRDEEWR